METVETPPRPREEADWSAFVDSYGRAVLDWVRQTGLPDGVVRALVAELLGQFAREFTGVAADPAFRFRAWLQFAGHKAWARSAEARVDAGAADGSVSATDLLLSVDAHDEFLRMLDAECTRQRRRAALVAAEAVAAPAEWAAFAGTVLHARPPADVAADLGCSEFTVRAAAHRVQVALQQQLRAAEEGL